MERFYFLILALILTLSGCGTAQKGEKSASESPAQNIQVDQNLWDFGQIKQGQLLKHEFILRNESSETLNLKDATTSCGCTVLEFKKKVLLPAESTTIEVKFDSKDYLGPIQQFVYVNTDSKDNPVFRFIIKAYVTKD